MSDSIKITFAQLNPIVGAIEHNSSVMLDVWRKHDEQSDLVIFPELFLCGYPPEDLVLNAAFAASIRSKISEICKKSKNFSSSAIIPCIWEEELTLFNAALLIEKGNIKHIFKKHKLPNNQVFDEPRTFTPGDLPEPYEFKGHKLGFMICEDIWHVEVPEHLKSKGAKILIAINGSPFHDQKDQERLSLAHETVEKTGLDLIYLNMVGGQDELVFDGMSFAIGKDQDLLYTSPAFEDDIFTLELSPSGINRETLSVNPPKEIGSNGAELLYKALVTGVRDYVTKNGFSHVLLGLSGGIDSALTAAIAADSLGSSNVRCVMLPSAFTSDDSINDALECSNLLNVSYETIPISGIMEGFEASIPPLSGIAHENTQSRIRGSILMALSNASGAMLLTTGNKSETAVGYCTLYGDMNGGFNPLKDVYKTQVYELARWRNTQSQVIPENILTKAPTAELRENQKDQDSLPPYDLLDDILRLLIEYDGINWSEAPDNLLKMLDKCLQHPETIEKVAKLLRNTEYKRFQAAPGTRISYRAFGRDRRYPITNHFINKIEKP